MLGLNPDMRIAVASYSASLASRFNRRVQRIMDSSEYGEKYPKTRIKSLGRQSPYIRTSDEVEIIDHEGGLLSVGREGSLTGNRVDCFILDDLYKDAMEANSPLIRENCWEWYASVVRTRMHNDSQELIVFTRWHEEDLIGSLKALEPCVELREWADIDKVEDSGWLHLNFEALKTGVPTEIDPRQAGEALWPERQSVELLETKRRLDPMRFEAMYQGRPTSRGGLLYSDGFAEWEVLPDHIVRRANYTDTADMGDDYLCSVSYAVDADGVIYVLDVVYSREPMEVTENLVADMLQRSEVRSALIESNNGGRGFARAVQRLVPRVKIDWFHQSANKQARILSHSATVVHNVRFPRGWAQCWHAMYAHLMGYKRDFNSNRWHDAADVLTGIVEQESVFDKPAKITRFGFM
jgi:predicted phage terminase large subunit-like protein